MYIVRIYRRILTCLCAMPIHIRIHIRIHIHTHTNTRRSSTPLPAHFISPSHSRTRPHPPTPSLRRHTSPPRVLFQSSSPLWEFWPLWSKFWPVSREFLQVPREACETVPWEFWSLWREAWSLVWRRFLRGLLLAGCRRLASSRAARIRSHWRCVAAYMHACMHSFIHALWRCAAACIHAYIHIREWIVTRRFNHPELLIWLCV